MTFPEFLTALGEERYLAYLDTLTKPVPLPGPFHDELIRLLKQYYLVGGMPAAVKHFVQTQRIEEARALHSNILRAYALDFAKHAPATDIPKLSLIWESIPTHLSRENKKFIFSTLSRTARAREYENALQWLGDAGLIHQSFAVETVQQPLQGFIHREIFKVFALDVGLLATMAKIPLEIFVNKQELFTTFYGAFVENYIAQQLTALGQRLLYWRSPSHQAEIDFLFEKNAAIYPLEVKAGVNPKSKSFASYDTRFHPPCLARSTLLNLKRDGRILNVPLYAIHRLNDWLE